MSTFLAQARSPVPPERVRAELERVLGRAELHPNDWLGRFASWLGDLFSATGMSGTALAWIAGFVLVALAAVLFFWVLRWRLARIAPRAAPAVLARLRTAERVAELRRRAGEARRAGDLRLALRLLFFALVVGLGERGDLRYRDAWTNRELLARGEPNERTRGLLGPLLDDLEAKDFGRVPATEGDVARLEDLCERWLGGSAA